MDLSINRLKVLGDEEIQRLDLKIAEYKSNNQSSILDKSISEIKTQISDLSSICNDLEIEVNRKNSIIGQLQNTLSEYQKKYETLNENILSIELSITEYENRKIELQSQFELMDNTISRLKIEEQKNKDSYEQLNIKLEQRKIQFKSEKEQIDSEVKKLELKIKELMQSSLVGHTDFINEVKSIELKQAVNDTQAIFDSIKFDLLMNLSRNIFVYGKKIIKETKINYMLSNLGIIQLRSLWKNRHIDHCIDIHSLTLCDGKKNQHDTAKKCNKCNHKSIGYLYYGEFYQEYTRSLSSNPDMIKYHNIEMNEWIKQNYDRILENIIVHPELLILIKKLNYQDFYNLFTSYEPFNINDIDSYQFISLIAFIATNGYDEKYMKLNELE